MIAWQDAARLGRVSNLPTTWSNVLAAWILSSSGSLDIGFWILLVAITLFYLGGMFLNDAFDADIDAIDRPDRPIPSGRVKRRLVFQFGFFMLLGGGVFVALATHFHGSDQMFAALLASLFLVGIIVLYNIWHKSNPFSPMIMGASRFLIYICCALVVASSVDSTVLLGGIILFLYVVGLTCLAKQENMTQLASLWPLSLLAFPPAYGVFFAIFENEVAVIFTVLLLIWIGHSAGVLIYGKLDNIQRSVSGLIAGISLLDAQLIAMQGESKLALAAFLAFLSVLLLQRRIPGT